MLYAPYSFFRTFFFYVLLSCPCKWVKFEILKVFAVFLLLLFSLLPVFPALSGEIAVDGSTATQITSLPNGKALITIAPPASGISQNRYQTFNVSAQGVDFQNQTSGARVILNEVTGASPSLLQGPMSVVGAPAHLILANPQGIVVDGGRFVNTHSAILAASKSSIEGGKITFEPSSSVVVTGGGLAAEDGNVSLLGQQIAVQSSLSTPGALEMIAGSSQMTLGEDGRLSFSQVLPSVRGRAVGITIGSGAVLNGGSIRVISTEKGVGVSSLGDMQASSGDISITSAGELSLSGHMNALEAISLEGASVHTPSSSSLEVRSTHSGVRIASTEGAIHLDDFKISAHQTPRLDFSALGAIVFSSASDLFLNGTPSKKSSLTSESEDVALLAQKSVFLTDMALEVPGRFLVNSFSDVAFSGTALKALSSTLWATGNVSLKDISLATTYLNTIEGAAIDVTSSSEAAKTSLLSSDMESVQLKSSVGDISVFGSKILGFQAAPHAEGMESGALFLSSAGSLTLSSLDSKHLTQLSSGWGDIVLEAQNDISNFSASLVSGGNIIAHFGGVFSNKTQITAGDDPLIEHKRSGISFFGSESFKVEAGKMVIPDHISSLMAASDILLSGGSFLNTGGDVEGRIVTIDLSGEMRNESRLIGSAFFKRACFFLCWANGASNISLLNARIAARQMLSLTTKSRVFVKGASMFSNLDMDIQTPNFHVEGLFQPFVILRSAGFSGLFGLQDGYFVNTYEPGVIRSFFGTVHVLSPVVTVQGSIISSQIPPISAQNMQILEPPFREGSQRRIGWFQGVGL